MKIRHPILLSSFGLTLAWVVRAWMSTMRFRHVSLDPNFNPRDHDIARPHIWAIWHENLLLPLYHYSRSGMKVLVSHHADGTFLSGVCRQMGVGVVRGSTSRGGVEAVQELIKGARRNSLGITPDGPRGPRRRVQAGVVFLASRTGLPVVPLGFGYQRAWRMRSWDQFVLPVPGSLGTCVVGVPIKVPFNANRRQLEEYRRIVEQRMMQATELAEAWAKNGRLWRNAAISDGATACVA